MLSPTAALEATAPLADRPPAASDTAPTCEYVDLGNMEYGAAWDVQRQFAAERKQGVTGDCLLFAEHPHVITMGRVAKEQHLLVSRQQLERAGIALWETDRGGDITYHGPGQLIGYPIFDLKEWKRDVVAYLRVLEQVLIDAVGEFGIAAERLPGSTGVWVGGAKLAALGVHVSRWVTSHGFALNVTTDLSRFDYIVPCGLSKPVTSIERLLGEAPPREAVVEAITRHFGRVFGRTMTPLAAQQNRVRTNPISERQ
ncbi:MAG: lipoyl(octanoyl) transferase LipB [Bryobacterales bacterium]